MTLPDRPRLAERVRPRRQVVEGRAFVLLCDADTGSIAQIGVREWELCRAADGTRDLEGIRLAAAQRGAHAKAAQVRSFFEGLLSLGWIELPSEIVETGLVPAAAPAERSGPRPIRLFPNYLLRCDGRGTCCRLYQTLLFSPLDVARARSLLPMVQGAGDDADRAFTPERGGNPSGALVPTFVHGRCAYLDGRDLCRIHAAGGEAAKPLGCRLFPLVFVDDGESVRVAPTPECACVTASALEPGGDPLLPDSMRSSADLPPEIFLLDVPDSVEQAPGKTISRASYLGFERELARRIEAAPADPAASVWVLAGALERGAPVEEGWLSWDRPALPTIEELREALGPLLLRLEQRVREDASWRATNDLAGRIARGLRVAAEDLARDGGRRPRDGEGEIERFHLAALAFAHRFALTPPLSGSLRAAALRLLLGRALADVFEREGESDAALRFPVVAVEALLRSSGLPCG